MELFLQSVMSNLSGGSASCGVRLDGHSIDTAIDSRRVNKMISVTRDAILHLATFIASLLCVAMFGPHWPSANAEFAWLHPVPALGLIGLLLLGYRFWPGILLGSIAALLWQTVPFGLAAARALGLTFEIVVGAVLLRRVLGYENSFNHLRAVIEFVVIAPLSTAGLWAAFAAVATTAYAVYPWSDFGSTWLNFWLSSATCMLMLVPSGLALSQFRKYACPWSRQLEAAALLGLVQLTSLLVFSMPSTVGTMGYPLAFVPLPFLVWTGIRFGQPGAALAALLAVLTMAWGTSQHWGPFANRGPQETLVLMATYASIAALAPMLVAVVFDDLTAARQRLAAFSSELEAQVQERTQQLSELNANLQ